MQFKMSPNVAVRTDRFAHAVAFYEEVLGFKNRSEDQALGDHAPDCVQRFLISFF